MKFIDESEIANKIVLLRTDFNVPLSPDLIVENDERIRASLPSINYLLSRNCKVVIVSHLGRPDGIVNKMSLRPVFKKLKELLPNKEIGFIEDLHKSSNQAICEAREKIFLLENIRFYKEEQENDPVFAARLASLAEVFVNDAFSVSHRADASVVGVTKILPSYGGLLLKKELTSLQRLLKSPEKPFVAVLGGSKISTKLEVIDKLSSLVSSILVGGGIANIFLFAKGFEIGKSICEREMIEQAKSLIKICEEKNILLGVPEDVVVGNSTSKSGETQVRELVDIKSEDTIYDIGPKTRGNYKKIISEAKTIVWNGPVGYFENPTYIGGTDGIYEAITSNSSAFSVAGGGDTITYLSSKKENDKISFISTGGGAMLEYLAKGSLPGIDALS